eukprot:1152710-Amphidinium_carterae.1
MKHYRLYSIDDGLVRWFTVSLRELEDYSSECETDLEYMQHAMFDFNHRQHIPSGNDCLPHINVCLEENGVWGCEVWPQSILEHAVDAISFFGKILVIFEH